MKGKLAWISSIVLTLSIPKVLAHCPLCTGAVAAGAVTVNYYGLGPGIIGVFVGAFGISTGLWAGKKLKAYIPFQLPLLVFLSFLLTIVPIVGAFPDSIFVPANLIVGRVLWLNKFLMGGIAGGIATLLAYWYHLHIKKVNGRVLFPFQGIALTIAALLATSGLVYWVVG
ncbi:hypothetical protein HYS48_04320 [Candidatus Woesearchaeota archaeon]|nr:hypothetical protein [Candidatus Woesearchaeota archaeon]